MHIQAPPGELRFTLEIKRAATGLTETVEMVGKATPEQLAEMGLKPVPADEQGEKA